MLWLSGIARILVTLGDVAGPGGNEQCVQFDLKSNAKASEGYRIPPNIASLVEQKTVYSGAGGPFRCDFLRIGPLVRAKVAAHFNREEDKDYTDLLFVCCSKTYAPWCDTLRLVLTWIESNSFWTGSLTWTAPANNRSDGLLPWSEPPRLLARMRRWPDERGEDSSRMNTELDSWLWGLGCCLDTWVPPHVIPAPVLCVNPTRATICAVVPSIRCFVASLQLPILQSGPNLRRWSL